jgi:hypothetical protein
VWLGLLKKLWILVHNPAVNHFFLYQVLLVLIGSLFWVKFFGHLRKDAKKYVGWFLFKE